MSKISSIEILSKNAFESNIINNYDFQTFHEITKLNILREKILGKNISQIISNPVFIEGSVNSSHSFVTFPKINLPSDFTDYERKTKEFREILFSRRSTREFSSESLTLSDLSYILNSSYGISGALENVEKGYYQELRTSPSAGGLYPLEIYFYANNIEGLEMGVYHYNPSEHNLSILQKGELDLSKYTSYSSIAKKAACVIFITAVFPRLSYKYGERSYRFVHLDAGHLGQNIYLSAESIDIGALAIGGFFDDEINNLLDIDGVTEGIVYEFLIGHKDEG
ncbi:SagB/ThcOx family dehydrogenase [Streptococcus suis]